MIRRFLLILLSICLFSVSVSAQFSASTPIHWKERIEMTGPDTGVVIITATIDKGWHLYGTHIPDGGPVATTFEFTESLGVEFCDELTPSQEPEQNFDVNFGMELSCWKSSVTFRRNFQLSSNIENMKIDVTVRYMACNDRNCAPPKTVQLTASMKP